ncbi:PR-1-like protein [Rhizoclosmatium globosum]|uniref:PR-1-like protein n=1 Tax=Rhizoclosmatium globosum TaxID=329046 RepID=A0A1Y2CX10_9FUNG|nr:PR-1-like protein [Rhizoclosmatium globosum]|eukprot:ORY51550.1 PR-1-like protein [Rhizoclosmatium globosum]
MNFILALLYCVPLSWAVPVSTKSSANCVETINFLGKVYCADTLDVGSTHAFVSNPTHIETTRSEPSRKWRFGPRSSILLPLKVPSSKKTEGESPSTSATSTTTSSTATTTTSTTSSTTTTTTTTTTQAPPSEIDSSNLSQTDQSNILAAHNNFRALHGIPPLSYDVSIGTKASFWAQTLASRNCALEHGDHDGLGQNLAMMSGTYHPTSSMEELFSLWSSESLNEAYNHATQVLWYSTKSVGCALQWGNDGKCEVLVCNYYPPGNVIGTRYDGTKQ